MPHPAAEVNALVRFFSPPAAAVAIRGRRTL
jgi:hypothetical protein